MSAFEKVKSFFSKKETDMTEGAILPHLLMFALPLLLGLILQQFYNTVDTIVAGRYIGKTALAAVGSTGSIINVFVGVCAGLSTGAGVIISQRFGAKDSEGLKKAVQTVVTATVILCVVTTVLGILLVDPMLRLMDTPEEVYGEARRYLVIYLAGISGLLMYNIGSGILRAVGDSVRPLMILFVTAVVNIVTDLLFVIAFRMGVAGTAWATVLSQFVSAFIVFYVLTKTDADYGVRWKKLYIDTPSLMGMIRLGLPMAIQHGLTSFSNVFVQSHINAFGPDCMAGWSAFTKIDVYAALPAQSISLSTTTFVGQNWGANSPKRAREGVRIALYISFVIAALFAAVIIGFHEAFIKLFNSDADVIKFGTAFILTICPFCLLHCLNQILAGALRGVGQAKLPTYVMLFSFVFFRQAVLLVNDVMGGGFTFVKLAYPLGWVLCAVLLLYYYRRSHIFYPDGVPRKITVRKRAFTATALCLFLVSISGFVLVAAGLFVPTEKKAAEYEVRGVDVSHYQGDIDWQALKEQGVAFAYIKATEGKDFVDPFFDYNIREAEKAEISAGAYHFFSFDSLGSEQADLIIETVPKDTDLPIALDVELYGEYKAFAPDREIVYRELGVLIDMLTEHYGRAPILYTTAQTDKKLNITEEFDLLLWQRDLITMPEEFTFWQYSSRGVLEGYSGEEKYIDMNVFYGTEAEFMSFTGKE